MFREERDIEDMLMMNLVLEGRVVGFPSSQEVFS